MKPRRDAHAHYYVRRGLASKRIRLATPYQSACGLTAHPTYLSPLLMRGTFPFCKQCQAAVIRGWMP